LAAKVTSRPAPSVKVQGNPALSAFPAFAPAAAAAVVLAGTKSLADAISQLVTQAIAAQAHGRKFKVVIITRDLRITGVQIHA
jgi:hypothetical protein